MKKTLLRRLVVAALPLIWGAYLKRRRANSGGA